MTEAILVKLDPKDPNLARVREIARGSRGGKIVAFPTETVYGIGAPMSSRGVREALAKIKGRDGDKPFSYHIADWDMVDYLGVQRSPAFRYISRQFWPGPVTLIVWNDRNEKIGIRFPQDRLCSALINATGEPFVATSANKSGDASPYSAEDVVKSLKNEVDYIIDGGPTTFQADSTIVDLTGDSPKILREGALIDEVKAAIEHVTKGDFPRKKVLVVCTGNSCRSPMAEGWLKSELLKRGLANEIEVSSCGIGTREGMLATPEAVFVMKNREIDIAGHKAHQITREDIIEADVILAMSRQHYTFMTSLVPHARNKMKVYEILDPIGSGMNVYEQVMQDIEQELEGSWDWIVE